MTTRLRWLMSAGPSDYLLAMSVGAASLPVVGKHLEPLGGMTAMSIWGVRQAPELIGAAAKSMFAPGAGELRRKDRDSASAVAQSALRGVVNADALNEEWPAPDGTPPVWKALEHRRNVYRSSVRYGDHPSQLLDVWRPKELPAQPAPVLIFVPGGAWVHGSRILQGYALMAHLAEMGWVCLSIDYRVAPNNRWPQHITDVKTAIAWARANVDKFGGDRDFVAIAGTSACRFSAAVSYSQMRCHLDVLYDMSLRRHGLRSSLLLGYTGFGARSDRAGALTPTSQRRAVTLVRRTRARRQSRRAVKAAPASARHSWITTVIHVQAILPTKTSTRGTSTE